jgi:DNA modification methylase
MQAMAGMIQVLLMAQDKKKQIIGIPWRLAFALQDDGWLLRQEIIWHKPNPMPESVKDRCTKSHEQIFLLSKSPRYYFDTAAIKEPAVSTSGTLRFSNRRARGMGLAASGNEGKESAQQSLRNSTRNRRSVWSVPVRPYKGAHFATFPPSLIEPCILAGSRVGDVVLDPFMGSGTTAAVALRHDRQYLGCELNPAYQPLQEARIADAVGPLFA